MEHRTKYSKLKDIIRLNNFFTLDLLVDILQGLFLSFFHSALLQSPLGAIYKENSYRNILQSEYNNAWREGRGRLHVDTWLEGQKPQFGMIRLWGRCMVGVLTAEMDSWEDHCKLCWKDKDETSEDVSRVFFFFF